MFRASATTSRCTSRYDGDIPGWDGLARHDQLIVGDFDGDGKADLFIFNGDDWSMSYLGMFHSTGAACRWSSATMVTFRVGAALRSTTSSCLARISSDNRTDLFAWNYDDWAEEYLGRMISTGNGLRRELYRRLGRRMEPRRYR